MRKTCKKRTVKVQPKTNCQVDWYTSFAENYQLPTTQLTTMFPNVKIGTIRRYKNFLSHYANGNTYLTRSMPSGLKKAYLSVRSVRSKNKPTKVKKSWNIECSFNGKESTFSTTKEYKNKKSVLSAITKALKSKGFRNLQIIYKEN